MTNLVKSTIVVLVALGASSLVLGGCGTTREMSRSDSAPGMASVANAKEAPAPPVQSSTAFEGNELMPPGARPGECYARVFVPPQYRTVSERMLKQQAVDQIEVVPAKTEWVEEKVLVKGPSQRLEVVPATYGWVEEKVLVQQEISRLETTPETWETVTETVVDRPAETVWKKGRGPIEKVDDATGEIMCLVEVPATYKTVTKRVVARSAETREVKIPAAYETVRKEVMTTPPTTRVVDIPAEYATVKVQKVVSPPHVDRTPIEAQYQDVTRTELVSEGRMDWRRILCETNVTQDVIQRTQMALLKAGNDPGRTDGVMDKSTMEAVRSYQRAKGLPAGNLTYETLDSLGVKLVSSPDSSS